MDAPEILAFPGLPSAIATPPAAPAMQCRTYELNAKLGLVPIDPQAGRGLPVGTVLHWGGNMGWSARDFCVLSETPTDFGGYYDCFDLAEPEKNQRLHRVEYSSVKRPDAPGIWHGQHFFITGRTCTAAECAGYLAEHRRQAEARAARQVAAEAEADRIRAIGRRVWTEVWPAGARWAIVAERIHDDSDIQTDYFGEHTEDTIMLAPSFKARDDFKEMRKAAVLIPETRHLGPGCDSWRVMRKAAPDDQSNRTWLGRLNEYDHGRGEYSTEAEAQAAIAAALAADARDSVAPTLTADAAYPRLPWGGELAHEPIEHREKYSGGRGFYLESRHSNPWRVSKTSVTMYRDGAFTDEPTPGTLYAIGKRHEHLRK